MGKKAYRDALNSRLKDLVRRIVELKLRREYVGALERLWYLWETPSLERQQQALEVRRRELDRERDSLWGDIKADVGELPTICRVASIERLDANYAVVRSAADARAALITRSKRALFQIITGWQSRVEARRQYCRNRRHADPFLTNN